MIHVHLVRVKMNVLFHIVLMKNGYVIVVFLMELNIIITMGEGMRNIAL